MKEIPLTKGKVALVDDQDFNWLNQWKWHALFVPATRKFYAARTECLEHGERRYVYMHQLLLSVPDGFERDHRDGNGLNNQRHNLRQATHAQNGINVKSHRDGSSKFKGVSWDKVNKKWRADCLHKNIGRFSLEEEAARAYDKLALKLFGQFANLNFPPA